MATNALARANALTTQKDAAWHDGGDVVGSSQFPPPDGNDRDPHLPDPNEPPYKGQSTSSSVGSRVNGNGVQPQSSVRLTNGAAKVEPRRFTPRSPRTALEPEQVRMPMGHFR